MQTIPSSTHPSYATTHPRFKTLKIVFSRFTPGALIMAGTSVALSDKLKLLGVTLDRCLTMDSHVNQVIRSANFHTRALRHVINSLSGDTARTVAQALVSLRLDYANSILFGMSGRNLIRLQRSQNMLARVVTRSHRRASATAMLRGLHWLPVKQRIEFKLAALTFKTVTLQSPIYLVSLLSFHQPARSLRWADMTTLKVPRSRTATGARAFRCAAPAVWNKLPRNIRSSQSIDTFRKKLKTFYFRQAFC